MSTRSTGCNEFITNADLPIPNMVGPKDFARIQEACKALGPESTVIEFGPWLGALSAVLAQNAKLHVVDAFKWEKSHASKLPELAAVGESFQEAFEATMKARGLDVGVHATEFSGFQWSGGALDLCLIDAPKKAADLALCLGAVLGNLSPGAPILIKNAATPAYSDMVSFLERLLAQGVLRAVPGLIDRDVNMLTFQPGPNAGDATLLNAALEEDDDVAALSTWVELAPDHPLHLGAIYRAIRQGDMPRAYRHLAQLPKERKLVRAWEKIEMKHLIGHGDPIEMSTFSEVLAGHCSTGDKPLPVAFHASPSQALSGFWVNNEKNDWRAQAFWPEILMRAQEFGYLNWPGKIREHVHGRDVLDVGCGPGLHGIGFLAAGAKSYLGLDPIIKPDRDRVKNLAQKGKMAFGWTPSQIAARLSPWRAEPVPLSDISAERSFDIAVLHNVTEHLHDLDGIFADIALRLRPGGKLLFNHHNYYSWNGHHTRPKKVDQIDKSDPAQANVVDWAHVEFDAPAAHYISRGLNRLRLHEVEEVTARYFDVEMSQDMPSGPREGAGRLTGKIMGKYPYLAERDFEVQNLLCIAQVRT